MPFLEARMRVTTGLVTAAVMLLAAAGGEAQKKPAHLNPMIELHAQNKPIFGLYAPSNPRGRGNRGAAPGAAPAGGTAYNPTPPAVPATPPPAPPVLKGPAELAKEALAYEKSDFVFDG